jgi:CHASE1-domain containing sensor protein
MSDEVKYPSKWWRLGLLLIIAVTGLVISVVVYFSLLMRENRSAWREFELDARTCITCIEQQFRRDVSAIWGASGFIRDSRVGTRQDFQAATEPRLSGGIKAFAWVPRVKPDERVAHEQAAEEAGLADGYQILQRSADGHLVPADDKDGEDCYPIYFIYPEAGNLELVGLDLASHAACRQVIERAAQTGGPTLSSTGQVVRLVDGRDPDGLLIFRPVFRELATDASDPNSGRDLLGFVVSILEPSAILQSAMDYYPKDAKVNVELFDDTASQDERFICAFDSKTGRPQYTETAMVEPRGVVGELPTKSLDVPAHQWAVRCAPAEGYVAGLRSSLPLVSLVFGIVITALVTTYASSLIGRTAKVEQLVVRRTEEPESSAKRTRLWSRK